MDGTGAVSVEIGRSTEQKSKQLLIPKYHSQSEYQRSGRVSTGTFGWNVVARLDVDK
jgi:hypothetical protein